MSQRIEKLIDLLLKNNIGALLVTHQPNLFYLAGYPIQDSYLIISAKKNFFITDFRYIQQARENIKGFIIDQIQTSYFETVSKIIKGLGVRRVGFEAKHLAFGEFGKIKRLLGKSCNLVPTYDLVESQRVIKDKGEIKKITKAISLTASVFRFFKSILRPGIREIDLATELGYFINKSAAQGSSFPIIIASGKNSSYPHAPITGKRIKSGEPVLIDAGVNFEGYKSDLTRVFFLDRISPKIRKIYDIVLEAQKRAIKSIRPGEPIRKIDKASRQYISQKGYGKFFGHNLGHGIGLEVHEAPPISSKNNDCIVPGMVFTIEPAIYLPGEFGIRLEDIILVTEKGTRVLSDNIHKSS